MKPLLLFIQVLLLGATVQAQALFQSCIAHPAKSGTVNKIRVSQGVQLGMIVATPAIMLSKDEKRLLKGLGDLKISFNIDTTGSVECYELFAEKSTTLTPVQVEGLKKKLDEGFAAWRFKPYHAGGRVVEVETKWDFEVKKETLRYRVY